MEESKAAAYYDELTRKGEGAARFKQGLGFTSQSSTTTNSSVSAGSALPSSSSTSSFLSNFVRSSAPNTSSELQHQSELQNIKNKLKKKPHTSDHNQPRVSDRDREKHSRRRSRSRSRERSSRHRNRSSSRDGERRRRSRKRSRSGSEEEERGRRRGRERSRSLSPPRRRKGRSERSGEGGDRDKRRGESGKERNGKVDYSRLIDGFDKMSPAERVKAKMKLQLTETVEKDTMKGMGSGWERFEFNKDAPLDDEEMEAVEDDAKLVKHIGQSFRFSAVEARKEEETKAAHDKAMFGAPAARISDTAEHKLEEEEEEEENKTESNKNDVTCLVSEKVLAKQQGSWRDRVRKV